MGRAPWEEYSVMSARWPGNQCEVLAEFRTTCATRRTFFEPVLYVGLHRPR